MTHRLVLAACALTLFVSAHSHARDSAKSSGFSSADYQAALDGVWRSAENRARDPYRHPAATLQFFGLDRGQTVIEIRSGDVTTAEVISLATNAGFTVDAQSEINANPKDTKNYPQGVWNLPSDAQGWRARQGQVPGHR